MQRLLTPNLRDSVSVANTYAHFVTAADSNSLDSPCSLQEVHVALASFNKDRSPGPDGWTVEFFIHFFDLVGPIFSSLLRTPDSMEKS
jgi:predicted trehalose synthase